MEYILSTEKETGSAAVTLTTDSPQSHYGIPVVRFELLPDSPDCGPADLWPDSLGMLDGLTCADEVFAWGRKAERTEEEISAAKLFLSQWPDGPQLILGENYPITDPNKSDEQIFI